MRHALRELDPDFLAQLPPYAQQQDAILYSWTTGERRLDLKRLFDNIIGQAIQDEAAGNGHGQTPYCQPLERALRENQSPILSLAPEVNHARYDRGHAVVRSERRR